MLRTTSVVIVKLADRVAWRMRGPEVARKVPHFARQDCHDEPSPQSPGKLTDRQSVRWHARRIDELRPRSSSSNGATWDELLRLAASLRHGWGRLQAGRRRNPLAQALQEYGRLIKTNFVNAIIAWNTVYTSGVLDEMRTAGKLITTSEIEHISPLAHQHIHLYGHYPFDLATRPNEH